MSPIAKKTAANGLGSIHRTSWRRQRVLNGLDQRFIRETSEREPDITTRGHCSYIRRLRDWAPAACSAPRSLGMELLCSLPHGQNRRHPW